MALFGGSKSTTTNKTDINERNLSFVDYSEGGGSPVAILDSPGARVTQTDQGAIKAAFAFGDKSLDFAGDAFDSALGSISSSANRAISAAENASRGELSQLFKQYGQYAVGAFAIFAIVRAFR